MRNWAALVCVLLAACASPQPSMAPPEFLFKDNLFSAPSDRVTAADVLALLHGGTAPPEVQRAEILEIGFEPPDL